MDIDIYYFNELCNYAKEQQENIINLRKELKNKWDDIFKNMGFQHFKKDKIIIDFDKHSYHYFIIYHHFNSNNIYDAEINLLNYYIQLNNKSFKKDITEHLKIKENYTYVINNYSKSAFINKYGENYLDRDDT